MTSFFDTAFAYKRKAELFERMLREVAQKVSASGKRCCFCNGPVLAALAEVVHTSDCLITRIEAAIAADADTARTMLGGLEKF